MRNELAIGNCTQYEEIKCDKSEKYHVELLLILGIQTTYLHLRRPGRHQSNTAWSGHSRCQWGGGAVLLHLSGLCRLLGHEELLLERLLLLPVARHEDGQLQLGDRLELQDEHLHHAHEQVPCVHLGLLEKTCFVVC